MEHLLWGEPQSQLQGLLTPCLLAALLRTALLLPGEETGARNL